MATKTGKEFQELFGIMTERLVDLMGMLKYEGEFEELDRLEKSELENLIGMCQDFDKILDEVLKKRCPEYAQMHGVK